MVSFQNGTWYIALELALREMKASAPSGHKYNWSIEHKGTFPLIRHVGTVLSFSKDAHRTCPGVVVGHWLFTSEAFGVLMVGKRRNLKVKTRL